MPAQTGVAQFQTHVRSGLGAESNVMNYEIYGNFIGGEWVGGSSSSANRNISDISDVVGEYSHADKAQTEETILAVSAAQIQWSRNTAESSHGPRQQGSHARELYSRVKTSYTFA